MSTIDPNRATREHWLNGLGKEDDLTAVRTTKVLHQVLVERGRQDQLVAEGKFAWNCGDATVPWAEKLAVLMEEVGEAANEVVEWIITRDKYAADPVLLKMPPHRETYFRDRLRTELVQIAAVCVAFAESLTEPEVAVAPKTPSAQQASVPRNVFGQEITVIKSPDPNETHDADHGLGSPQDKDEG